jgi:hypothetical protein
VLGEKNVSHLRRFGFLVESRPALTHWAKFCRASGATDGGSGVKCGIPEDGDGTLQVWASRLHRDLRVRGRTLRIPLRVGAVGEVPSG